MARAARRPGGGFPGLRVPGLRFGKAAADGVVGGRDAARRRASAPGGGQRARPPTRRPRHGTPAAEPPPELQAGSVPRWLQTSAAWSWRLLLLAALLYVAARVAALLYIVIVPCAAAHPAHRAAPAADGPAAPARDSAPLAATWCTLLLAFVLLGGAGVAGDHPGPGRLPGPGHPVEAHHHAGPGLAGRTRRSTSGPATWSRLSNDLVKYLSQHQSVVEGAVLTGGRIVVELLAGVVLCFFVSFFLIKDGDADLGRG